MLLGNYLRIYTYLLTNIIYIIYFNSQNIRFVYMSYIFDKLSVYYIHR